MFLELADLLGEHGSSQKPGEPESVARLPRGVPLPVAPASSRQVSSR